MQVMLVKAAQSVIVTITAAVETSIGVGPSHPIDPEIRRTG